jgi:hypothetical protein
MKVIGSFGLYEALKAEGYVLPDECRDVRLIMGVDSVIVLQMDVWLTTETLAQVGRALVRLAEVQHG